jgi:branched-chain amino acid transport system ATP-binding protein
MLAMARALMSRPKLLMLDEPSTGLAPMVVEQVFSIVDELAADGTSVETVRAGSHPSLLG